MAREYTPEELGIQSSAQKEYTPAELGLAPTKQREYTPAELGLGGEQRRPEDVGFFEAIPAAAKRGIESLSDVAAGLGLAKSSLTGTEAETKAKMEAIKADQAKKEEKPPMTVADFERIYQEKGFLEAAKEAPKYIVEQFLQSAPQMAGPLAAGAVASPFLTPVGGALVGMGTYAVQQFGNFLVRQAQEKDDPKELEVAKAAITAAGTAPIGYFADRFTLGLGGIGEKAGTEVIKELAKRRAMGEIGAGTVAAGVAKRVGTGAAEGIIAEAPTEVLEQAAERYQAGLSLTDDKAMQEYKEAFFGAAAAGAGIGGAARGVETYGKYRQELGRERADEGTRIDTRTGEPSVSVPGEERAAPAGPDATDTGRVERTELPPSGVEAGEEIQPSALDQKSYDELLEIKNNYQIELNSMLYKNGNAPRVGTKRREEYDALHSRLIDIDNRLDQLAPAEATPEEAKIIDLQQAVDEKWKGDLFKEAIDNQFKTLTNLYNAGVATDEDIDTYQKAVLEAPDQMTAVARGKRALNPIQAKQKETIEQRVETPAANEPIETAPAEEEAVAPAPSREQTIEDHVPEQHKEKARNYLNAFNQYVTASRAMPEWPTQPTPEQERAFVESAIAHDAALAALPKEEQALLSGAFKATNAQEHQTAVDTYKKAIAPAITPAKKKRKSKKEIETITDDYESNPERLNLDDLDNLLVDPKLTKAQNTSPKADQVPLSDPLFAPAHPTVSQAITKNDMPGLLKALKEKGGTFLSSFADRLSQLGLTTTLGWDNVHYDLAMAGLKSVEGQKNRIIKWVQQIYPEVYRNKFDESKMRMPTTELLQSFQELQDGKLGIPSGMFTEDLKDVIKIYGDTVRTLNSPGTYFTKYNAIGLSLMGGGNSNYVVSHELAHAATHWAINNVNKLDSKQKDALGKLEALYAFAKARSPNPSAYGYNNLHEFVAEAFSRPEFQKELRAMKAGMATDQSVWSKFIQLVARLFGVDNVLFHTLANADILFSARSGNEVTNGADLLWSPERYDVSGGKFKLNPGERSKFVSKLIQNRTKWKDLDKSSFGKFMTSLGNQYRKYLLGALSVDQLADIYGDNMPQLKLYVKEVDKMISTRNAILKEGDPVITHWSNLLNKNPQKAEQLGNVMIQATLDKTDPDPKSVTYDPKVMANNPNLKNAWQAMASGNDGAMAVQIYRQVREFYERRMNEYVQVQVQRIAEYGKVKGLSDQEIATKQLEFKKDTEEKIIRPYFPIKRFGDYFLMVGQGKSKIFMQFEDAFARDAEMDKQRERLVKLGMTPEDAERQLWPGQGFNEVLNQKLNDVTQLNKIYEMIDDTSAGVLASAATDPTVAANQIAAMQKELKNQFGQYYLEMLPSESIKKMFLHRENVAGPSADMLRAFGLSRERIAYQRARFQHMPELFNIVEASKKRLKSMPTTQEKAVYGDVSNELAKQFKDGVLEPPKQDKLTTYLTHFGFLNFLTSPASAVVNMMAIPGLYIPVAGARYGGMGRVGKVVTKYSRMLGGTGFLNQDTGRYEFLSLARANLENVNSLKTKDGKTINLPKGKSLADVYTEGVNRNIIDTTLTHDSVAIGEHPSADYTGRWQKFMYYASLPFHAAEKFNREISYMTSFELAYDKYIGKGFTPDKAYQTALDEARDITQETMFNYNTTNKPRYFRGNLASVLLQFKMYPQNLSMLMFRTFYKAINQNEQYELDIIRKDLANAPKEVLEEALAAKREDLRQMKKEARDAFLGMMGMTFLTAGATGMPLWFIFSGLASAFHAAFGDDDDQPFDAENWFKNWANRTFGGFVGDSISRGLISQATGMNFADRMNVNLPDLWFPDVRKGTDETDYAKNLFIAALGPSVGALLVNYPEALKRFNDGYTERAMEAMMPAAIKNVMVGTRYLVEGQATSLKGDVVAESVSPAKAVAQMLGFSPESVAQAQRAAIEAKNANQEVEKRHADLMNAYFMALDSSDNDMIERVLGKIDKYNMTYPDYPIRIQDIIASVKKRYQDRGLASLTGGARLNKKLVPRLEGMLEYGKE